MEDTDLNKLRKFLQSKKRNDLSDLLKSSRSVLNESSTFGHYLYSTLSTFQIFSPVKQNEILSQLPREDYNEIKNAKSCWRRQKRWWKGR
ncbi:MAG: hypothetical protein LBD21_10075 [Tannerellaceae bacterium]|nr:hypothetical protein [Tannerellaceae bacterium]